MQTKPKKKWRIVYKWIKNKQDNHKSGTEIYLKLYFHNITKNMANNHKMKIFILEWAVI